MYELPNLTQLLNKPDLGSSDFFLCRVRVKVFDLFTRLMIQLSFFILNQFVGSRQQNSNIGNDYLFFFFFLFLFFWKDEQIYEVSFIKFNIDLKLQ